MSAGPRDNDLIAFLPSLDAAAFVQLYNNSEFVCQAVFRSLVPLAKQYVLRALFLPAGDSAEGGGFDLDLEQDLVVPVTPLESKGQMELALTQLRRLGILISVGKHTSALNPAFQKMLLRGIRGSNTVTPTPTATPLDVRVMDTAHITDDALHAYAHSQWTRILNFIVAPSGAAQSVVPSHILDLLVRADIIHPLLEQQQQQQQQQQQHSKKESLAGATLPPVSITNAGFQFLLQDMRSQLLTLLRFYLTDGSRTAQPPRSKAALQSSAALVQITTHSFLRVLFELSFLETGRVYDTSNASAETRLLLDDLAMFGMVYPVSSSRFSPTPLGLLGQQPSSVSATGAPKAVPSAVTGSQDALATGFILVETNFRIYAYTSSSLQISLLGLFSVVQYRLPNMVVCMMTRDSVRMALAGGITADQIINFLTQNAHPSMLANQNLQFAGNVIPQTVCDQIRLWERERNRVLPQDAVVFSRIDERYFDAMRQYASDKEMLLWSPPETNLADRTLVVRAGDAADFKEYHSLLSSKLHR